MSRAGLDGLEGGTGSIRPGHARELRLRLFRRIVWATPAIFAAYASLALLAANQGEIGPAAADRSLVLSIGLGALATLLGWLVLRRREGAVALASLGILAFYSYGHIYDGLKTLGPMAISLARHRYLWPFEVVTLLATTLLLGRTPSLGPPMARWLTASGWILLAFPVTSLLGHWISGMAMPAPTPEAIEIQLNAQSENLPDIYYVILDGYGREDVLRALYDYDNRPFLDFLRGRGFYVADRAMSNYNYTLYSMASSLNMAYLDPGMDLDSSYRQRVMALLKDNQVFAQARGLGYDVVGFATGYSPTTFDQADLFLEPDYKAPSQEEQVSASLTLNEFEGLLLDTTWGKAALDYYAREVVHRTPGLIDFNYEKHRARVQFTIASLSEIADRPGAYFVMAHVIAPHPPFVFGARGQPLVHAEPFSLGEIGCCERDEYVRRYPDQVEYVNYLLRQEIDEILEASDIPPIIILQGDHGPGGHLEVNNASTIGIQARMAILSAYLLPSGDVSDLDPGITPVNSFRLIFRQVFGGDFGQLEDMSYFLDLDSPEKTALVRPFLMDEE